jgi:Phosphate-selective porin O and P
VVRPVSPSRGRISRLTCLVAGWLLLPSGLAPAGAAEPPPAEPVRPESAVVESAPVEPPALSEPPRPEPGESTPASVPNLQLEGRVISGFEYQRERPRGAQTRPAEREYGFQLRQARIELSAELERVELNLNLDLADALSTDLGGGPDAPPFLRTATLEYRVSRALRLTVGRYKRPFSRVELTSALDLPVLRRGLLNGLLIEDNQWGDRAVGMMASGRLELAKLRWYSSFTNPSWSSSLQAEGVDAIGRVQLSPAKGVTLGVNGGYKYLRLSSQAPFTHDVAVGGDLGWKLGDGHLLLEGSFGDLPFETGTPRAFGVLLLADYELTLSPVWTLQPVLFAELADANARVSQTESARLAVGLNLLLRGGFRLLPQFALVRSLGDTSQENPWLESETYSLVFSLAL